MRWSRPQRRWLTVIPAALGAAAFLYAIWNLGGFVFAFEQIKHAHIFPTSVSAVGWDNPENALSQEMSPDAPFASFTAVNSASVVVAGASTTARGGGAPVPEAPPPPPPAPVATTTAPTSTPQETVPQTPTTTPAALPAATSTNESSTTVSTPPAPLPDESTSSSSTTAPSMGGTSAPGGDAGGAATTSMRAPASLAARLGAFASFMLSKTATLAFATTSDAPTTSAIVPDADMASTSTTTPALPPPEAQDVPTCTVEDITCHTIEFSGFNVAGSLTQKNLQYFELNFSFANLTSQNQVNESQLQVRYYHAGQWHSAGQIFLNNEISNSTNGGYFTATLDGLTTWSDLSDLKVVVEYVQGDTVPEQVYLDSLWVDGVYKEHVQDVLSGEAAQNPDDAPGNVTFSLAGGAAAGTLVESDGTSVSFPYLDTLTGDSLVLRSDQQLYQAGAGSSSVVYLSVTNPGTTQDSFNLFASFPGGQGQVLDVSQYLRNIPNTSTTTTQGDVAYYCQGGWQPASSSGTVAASDASSTAATSTAPAPGAYTCPASGESYICTWLNTAGDNCQVTNVTTGVSTSTTYQSGWVSMVQKPGPANDPQVMSGLPPGYQIAAETEKVFPILPGQTLYFRLVISTNDAQTQSFVLSAKGASLFGDLDSLHLRNAAALKAQTNKNQPIALKHAQLNEQLSTTTDFDPNALPTFHFRWKTQRSLFTQLKDLLTGTDVPFKVASAQLVHASGEEEHVPVDITYGTGDDWSISLEKPPRDFRPGKYTLDLTINEGGQTYSDSVQFYWGVLALNPDQSVYLPGQTARFSITALDDDGNTMCDAQLVLTVTDPSGQQSDIPVNSGGGCGRNNVTTLPDYAAEYAPAQAGTYALTLSRLDGNGNVVDSSTDSFEVDASAPFVVVRTGPTRVYPPSAYTMKFDITAKQQFSGTVEETVPEGFTVTNPGGASVRRADGVIYLDWDLSMQSGDERTLAYQFKVPQVSPYMYLLGPAKFIENGTSTFAETRSWRIAADSLPIATGVAWLAGTTTTDGANLDDANVTALNWNVSADYDTTYFSYSSSSPTQLGIQTAGDYLVALTLPMDRTDTSTRTTRVESDIRVDGIKVNVGVGRSSLIINRSSQKDSSDHLYVLLRNLQVGDYIEAYTHAIDTVNAADNIEVTGQASLYAEYIGNDKDVYFAVGTTTTGGTNLNSTGTSTLAWYDDPTLGRMDSGYSHNETTSSTTVTLASAGDYLVFVNIPISGAVTDGNVRGRVLINNTMVTGGDFKQGEINATTGDAASSIHWSGLVHATTTNEKLSIAVQAEANTGTLTVGTDQASLYIEALPSSGIYEANATALSGGTDWNVTPAQTVLWQTDNLKDTNYYTHSTSSSADQITVGADGDYFLVYNDTRNAAVTRVNQIVQVLVGGNPVTGGVTKTHVITNTNGMSESSGSFVFLLRNLTAGNVITVSTLRSAAAGTVPADRPAVLMLWHKAAQSSFTQDTERWYANVNAQTPTDPWPAGSTDLGEGDAITTGNSVHSGDVLRLRMALTADVSTLAGADSFKLQYAPGTDCSPALAWTDVGAIGSGSIWRGYDNAGVAAGSTLSSTVLSVSSTSETYEEQNPSAATPNAVTAGNDAEWDWVLQDNGAPVGTSYCFRMVESSGQTLKDYNDYPQLVTNNAPLAPTLLSLFDNEKTASTTPYFTFFTTDDDGDSVHYEVQVSTDRNFGSTVIDENTSTNFSKFSDVTNPSGKSPYASGDIIEYAPTATLTNGTTYWWRVRAEDPSGTNTWGSYSTPYSFTVDTSVNVSTWFQTSGDQFGEGTLTNMATTATSTLLSGANTSGTIWSPEIDYSEGNVGTAWGSFSWTDTQVGGTIKYHVEYLTPTSSWALIPDSDLPGNATGTSTPSINLTGLDTGTYASIRVRADFTKTTLSPVLADWTVKWGLVVSQPTLASPFDNEKVGTTTPTFTFNTTDPQGDQLTYQIQWSTDATFATGVSSSTSGVGSGFADTASSTATSPFPSDDTISYTMPTTTALTNGTTYWWRVRAKDPGGGNAYSLWSTPQSLTVDTSVLSSTWFQTTSDQFNEDALTLTTTSGGDVTASSDTGKIAMYRANAASFDNHITTAVFNDGWDTTVRQDDIYALQGTTSIILKNKGYYAVLYGQRFDYMSGTNRSVIQSDLSVASTTLPIGWSQGFIRGTGGSNEAFTSGGGIIKTTAASTTLVLQSFRTDANATEVVQRVATTSGIQIIKLDDSWNYLRLHKSTTQTGPTSVAWVPVTYDTTDEMDTSVYGHSTGGSIVTLKSPGHYLVFANTYGSLASGNTTETQVVQKLTLNGVDLPGSLTTVYMRGNTNSNGIYEGAASIGRIVYASTTNSQLTVQVARTRGTAAWTIDANSSGTYVNRSGLTIVKLPEGDFIDLSESTNDNINPASLTAFNWDTEYEKDTTSFTHSTVTNPSRVTANTSGDFLLLSGLYANPAATANGDYSQGWRLNGGSLIQYGQTGGYTAQTVTTGADGNWSGTIFPGASSGNYFEAVVQALGAAGTIAATSKDLQGVNIGTLVTANTTHPTLESPDIDFSDGTGPKWSSFSWSDTRPGSTSIAYQVLYYNSTNQDYELVPTTTLSGNDTGFTTSPVDISGLNHTTYGTLRTLATFSCTSGSCPTLHDWTVAWSQGINVSGTAKQFDETTNVTSGTVAVAVNGVLQAGKTGTISGGAWSIANVTAFTGDVITVFVQGATGASRAVAVTKYTTSSDITGMALYQGHLTLGSADNPTLTNTDLGQYDNSVSGNSAIFDEVDGSGNLAVCNTGDCPTFGLVIQAGTTWEPSNTGTKSITSSDLQINGTLIADNNTLNIGGSWLNNGAFAAGGSSVIFTATTSTKTVNSTGAATSTFYNVTFGQTSGAATWQLYTPLAASGTLAVNFGTLSQGSTSTLALSGNLSIGASGLFIKGAASTTFMGAATKIWSDASAGQDMGNVYVTGGTLQLGSAARATNLTIYSGSTFDVTTNNYGLTVLGNYNNAGTFTARSGTVTFAATTTGITITPGASSFAGITFNGSGGNWSFNGNATTTGDFTISAGTVTLPVGTTTIGGSFNASGGVFSHNNGAVVFNTSGSKTINPGTSSFYDLVFNGSGSWSFGANATSSRNTIITAGSVTLPAGVLAVGNSFLNNGGTFSGNGGTVQFTSTASGMSVKANGSSFSSLLFSGSGGGWSFTDTNATTSADITFAAGTTTLPSGTLAVGGSFLNTGGAFTNNSGTVRFTAGAAGKSVTPGSSSFYNSIFDSSTGGWTITANATSTNNFTLNRAASFTVNSGATLAVGGTFTNLVGGATTTWAGSTLLLYSGTSYSLNTKTAGGDVYGTLSVAAGTHVKMWNSSAATPNVASSGSLYSQNHAAVPGSLYIWGTYTNGGSEYWSYATDFDGTALGGGSRQVNVYIASSSSITLSGATAIVGSAAASTTVQNQGAGGYTLAITGGSLNAQYFAVASTDQNGVQLSGTPTITSLGNGSFTLNVNGGTMLTVASTVIDQNPALQIYQDSFATSSGVSSGYNITESGSPSSYWWFRQSYGNYQGEAHDNDPGGNPGYIRWDDSAFNLTFSGYVYSDHGTTALGAPTCDGVTPNVELSAGTSTYFASCDGSGHYSISGVYVLGDISATLFLNTGATGVHAATVTKTPTTNLTNLNLYQNAVIVRHEGTSPIAIADLAGYDSTKNSSIQFTAATGSPDTLSVRPDNELYVWGGDTFAPGGNITLQSGGSGLTTDGRLYVAPGAAFTAAGTQAHSVGGGLYVGSGSTFTAANSTITFTATTTGKSIYSAAPLTLYNVVFNGSGGNWSLDSSAGTATTTVHSLALTAGTLSGTGDIIVQSGDVAGSGTVALTGGTFKLYGTGNFANGNAWQFRNLVLGDGITAATTTKTGTGTTTVSGALTVAANQTLAAGSGPWVFSGGGTPLAVTGSLNPGTAPFYYTGTTTTAVANASYTALTLAPAGSGSPTYTLAGGTPTWGSLTIGDGVNPVTVTANTNDPSIQVSGDVRINAGATYVASDIGAFYVSGNWNNAGTFTNSNATVLFNATTTGKSVTPGSSPFYNLTFDSTTGGWTVTANATSTNNLTLNNASSFAVASSTTLAVGGTFQNLVGGSATSLASSTLSLYAGTTYTINTKSSGADAYGTLLIGAGTQVRMWNSSAAVVNTNSTGSLYSMNNANIPGNLYIWGSYTRSSGSDYWDYATDFDGTALGGSSRAVSVYIASSSSVTLSGGLLDINGSASATTTVQNQGSGAYALSVSGGTLSAQYYKLRNTDLNGLNLSGTPTITSLSNGDYQLAVNGGSMVTVTASVINTNPLSVFKYDEFATSSGVTSGYNVTESGAPTSYWKFNLHYGNYAGEAYDNDPGGDPGYIIWDNSANQITVAGNVYQNDQTTVSSVCDNTTKVVELVVGGSSSSTVACSSSDGSYSFPGISYNPGDTLTVYLDGLSAVRAANVTVSPNTNIPNMNLYEHDVIVRHEGASPITIANMAAWDSYDDATVPFRAVSTTSPNTLTLPPNTKLIIWTGKTFAPAGNVAIQSGGAANAYDGSLEVQAGATFSAASTQSHSIGGNFTIDSGGSLTAANSTFTFTATTTGKTIQTGSSSFYNLAFTGIGGNWSFVGSATTTNDFTVASGTVTLPASALAVGGSFLNTGGTFMHNNGTVTMTSTATGKSVRVGTSTLYNLTFSGAGGSWSFYDANATTSASFTVASGTVTLPSGTLAVGDSFLNTGGSFTNNSGTVRFTAGAAGKSIQANGSSFGSLYFAGSGGGWTFLDTNATTTGTVTFAAGTTTLPVGTLTVGGSFVATSTGAFTHSNGTVKFNATTTGKSVTPGSSPFYNLTFDSTTGGWTVTANATSTNNLTLNNASSFAVASSTTLAVGGTFQNLVGGSATSLASSTLSLYAGTTYTINTKSSGADAYGTLLIGAGTQVRMWNSSAAVVNTNSTGSLYSMNNANIPGNLYIWGSYTRSSGSDYWDYATDFDGTALGGSSRAVSVYIASSSSVTLSGGLLDINGSASATTTVQNQGSGAYALSVSGGTLSAQYYKLRNTDLNGLNLSGTPTITSLSNGDYQLAVNGGSMVTLASGVLDNNANLTSSAVSFSAAGGVTSGYNINLSGTPVSHWSFPGAYGNYAGEAYDNDGATACGSIRWDDSSCLFVTQAHYRWRNDDGGEGALASTWYNASWAYREQVVISNPNATAYTDYPVKIVVPYDSAMNSNFSDLRFTDSTGTTTIPFFIEKTVASASSTVWVNVPSLPASGSATVYMYFGNATSTDGSSGSGTFPFYESFESGSLSGYSGDASLFQAGGSFAYAGSDGLYPSAGNTGSKTTNGLYRTSALTSQGETIRYFQYVDANPGSGLGNDEPCALFGVGGSGNNYAVCLEEYPSGAPYIALAKNVTNNVTSGTLIASTSVTYATGWYQVSIDWLTNNNINVTLYNSTGAVAATLSATDSSHTSGGIGFTYWGQHGGWDYYTARQYAASAPTYLFGSRQGDNGATWLAAQDTALSGTSGLSEGQYVRLRFSVQNTGGSVNNQASRLQIAPQSTYASCDSVPYGNYSDVPTATGGCGSAAACMATSTRFTDLSSTSPSLSYPTSMNFTAGEMVEDPNNQSNTIAINTDTATEVEFDFKMTTYATGNAYCFRSTNAGTSLDNYDHIAQASMLHAPTLSNISFNGAHDISLTEGTGTTISVTASTTDLNGYADIVSATSTMYRSGVAGGPLCTASPSSCYQIASTSCTFSNCSGNVCSLSCSAPVQYFADPTDAGTYAGQQWLARVSVTDSTSLNDTEVSSGVNLLTLYGLALQTLNINFGSLIPGADTGTQNATTTIENTGNAPINIDLSGTDLSGTGGSIPVGQQKYATSTFTYGSCAICQYLTGSATNVSIELPKSTSTSTPSTSDIYWGISVPVGTGSNTYQGTNTFTATGG